MKRSSLRRTMPLTLAIVVVLVVLVAACGAAPTPTATPVPPTPTRAPMPPTATTAPGAAAPTATPAAATVSFAKDILPLFQKNCTRCHGGGSPRQGLSSESYASAMKGSSNGAVIVAGSPDKSLLYNLVKAGAMPQGGPKLADADVQKISDWIKAGAQNN